MFSAENSENFGGRFSVFPCRSKTIGEVTCFYFYEVMFENLNLCDKVLLSNHKK